MTTKNLCKHGSQIFIDGIATQYYVTRKGKVYSLNYRHTGNVRQLKPNIDKDGYEIVTLYVGTKQPHWRKIHRLVAQAFIPNPDNKPEVNHKDGNTRNNKVSNLEWVTTQENVVHAWKTGLNHSKLGENAPGAKYTNEKIKNVCDMIAKNKWTLNEISDLSQVSKSVVRAIYYRKIWIDISKDYDFSKFTKLEAHRLQSDEIHEICKLLEQGDMSMTDIANSLNIKYKTVFLIYKGKTHTEISSRYNFHNYELHFKIPSRLNHK